MSTWRPAEPPPGERDPRKLSELLDRTTRRLGGPSTGTTTAVFAGWDDIVGADIAAHARPVSLKDGVLTLAVDHPAWATQLRFMTAELLGRIGEATPAGRGGGTGGAARPEVVEIRIRVTGQPTPEKPFRRAPKRRF